jgi:hypothetical protein
MAKIKVPNITFFDFPRFLEMIQSKNFAKEFIFFMN